MKIGMEMQKEKKSNIYFTPIHHEFIKTKLNLLLVVIAVFFITLPSICFAAERLKDSTEKMSTSGKRFYLSITNGLVSLDSQGADLRKILAKISERTGIEIEISDKVKDTVTISFYNLPLEEALKKITRNRGIIFSKERGKNEFQISRVVILASSQSKTNSNNDNLNLFKPPIPLAQGSMNSTSSIIKTGPPAKPATSLTIINEKTGTKSQIVSNELVIRFKRELSKEDIQALIAKTGATVKNHIKALNYYVLSLPSHLSVNEALRWFRQQGVVDQTEPNYLIPIKVISNDPELLKQWALHNTGQTGGADDADIDALEAWDIEQGKTEVIIAIIDTGVDYAHEDLSANIWHNSGEIPDNGIDDDGNGYIDDTIGWDFVDSFGGAADEDFETSDNDPMDRHGHGTHVAGIAGAVTNNGLGIAGVAWNCKIMPVRAGYKTPSGDGVLESDDAAQAIIYAAENGARVINLSWGDYQKSNLIEDAMTFAIDKGALICAAAGNENSTNPIYPAASDNMAVLAVGATDSNDLKASFSNNGDWVDISAPGVYIYSTYLNNSYLQTSGTSMATPHVAGVAALLFSHFQDISPIEVKTRIMRSVDVLEDLNGKNSTSGRINAYSALTDDYSTPHIFSLTPDAAHEDDQVTIFGDSFGIEQGNGVVKFYPEKDAEVISWSNSTIICRVPEGARTGDVNVTTSEGTSNGIEITILIKFYNETLLENEYLAAGQAQGWQADDQSWLYQLPFSFPFFGKQYDSVHVCSNGYLDFTNSAFSYQNSQEILKSRIMIAPLWDDLITNGTSQQDEDIYIHSPSPDSVCIRWSAERYETEDLINVEVILHEDGMIQFNYGSGNYNLSSTIGISGGDGEKYHFASYNGITSLNKVQSVLFTPYKHSFTIPLDLSWNLISLPLEPDNNQVSQILGPAISGIESVWEFKEGLWQFYVPGDPETSVLEILKPGYGYWVKTNQEGLSIQIQGQFKTSPLTLPTGWHLIGFNILQRMPVEEALIDIEGEYESVWGYQDGVWQVYDPNHPGFSDLIEMEPGRGYWIKTDGPLP